MSKDKKTKKHHSKKTHVVLIMKPARQSEAVDVTKPISEQSVLLANYKPAFSEIVPAKTKLDALATQLLGWQNDNAWRFSPAPGDVVQVGSHLYILTDKKLERSPEAEKVCKLMPKTKLEYTN